MFPSEFKKRYIQNWVQKINPFSQGLARCHVTRQRCIVALAPKIIVIINNNNNYYRHHHHRHMHDNTSL